MPQFIPDSTVLEIEQGRHPVVELVLKQESLGLAGMHTLLYPMTVFYLQKSTRLP